MELNDLFCKFLAYMFNHKEKLDGWFKSGFGAVYSGETIYVTCFTSIELWIFYPRYTDTSIKIIIRKKLKQIHGKQNSGSIKFIS